MASLPSSVPDRSLLALGDEYGDRHVLLGAEAVPAQAPLAVDEQQAGRAAQAVRPGDDETDVARLAELSIRHDELRAAAEVASRLVEEAGVHPGREAGRRARAAGGETQPLTRPRPYCLARRSTSAFFFRPIPAARALRQWFS